MPIPGAPPAVAEVYLKDIMDFKGMNGVYAEKFTHVVKPARQVMQVAKLPLYG